MKTKERIIEAALALFNQSGWVNVTLRDVSAALNISYGNVTYHFASKEKVLEHIYANYETELSEVSAQLIATDHALHQLLTAPRYTFGLSLKYRFLFVDFIELQRQYPVFMQSVQQKQLKRKALWTLQLKKLQDMGMLRLDLNAFTFDFIMEMSGMVRTFFFLKVNQAQLGDAALETAYVKQVNAVIWPYLTQEALTLAAEKGFYLED